MSQHRIVLLASLVLSCCLPATAGEFRAQASIEYPVSSEFVVLELAWSGMVGTDPQQGPFVRVYGDGRVHVKRPSYYRDSGDFEAYLSHADLDALISLCASKGLMEFDRQVVKEKHESIERARLQEGLGVPVVSDAAHTILTIRLDSYAPAGSDRAVESFEHTASWYALPQFVSWYPELQELVRFKEFVDLLVAVQDATIEASASTPRARPEMNLWHLQVQDRGRSASYPLDLLLRAGHPSKLPS